MKKSIAVINTSLELFNLIEAIHYHQCTDNYLIVGHYNLLPDRIRKLKEVLKEPFIKKNFKKIYFLPSRVNSKSPFRFVEYLLGSLKLLFIFLFLNKIDYLFSGVHTNFYQRQATFLVSSFNTSVELWLIDEGVGVLQIVSQRNEVLSEEFLQKRRNKNWIMNYYRSIKKIDCQPPILHFFSAFDFPVKGKDVLIKNTMSYWKKNNPYTYKFKENAVVFIGQPLVEFKLTSLQTYKKLIAKIFQDVTDSYIYYFPHPAETRHVDLLPKNVEIVTHSIPVELLLIGACIKSIIGFSSTALYNAAILNICPITSYWIDTSDYLEVTNIGNINVEAIHTLRRTFEKVNIKIIPLS